MTKSKNVSIITRVPPELRKQFKAVCAARGVSMSSVLISQIMVWIGREKR